MKAIIGNKLYDTETAEELYEYRKAFQSAFAINGCHWSVWHDMVLYQTKKGTYFEYDKENGKIQIISEEKAKETIKQVNPDAYMAIWDVKVEEG